MSLERDLIVVSAAAAVIYGAALIGRPPSAPRTLVKAAAVGGLAGAAYITGSQLQLILALGLGALGLGALGDGLLATVSRRWLPAGLAAFLAGHLCYIWLFLEDGGGRAALLAEPWRNLGVAGAMAAGTLTLLSALRGLGPLKPAAAAYVAALTAMAACAFTLPHQLWPAMAGAVGLMISDGLLAAELFAGARSWWSRHAIWWLYYAGQAMIAWAYLR